MAIHCIAAAVAGLALASAPPAAIVGAVQVSGPEAGQVALSTDSGPLPLAGELTTELARLSNARVEVLGRKDSVHFWVQGYRILEVDGVQRPMVGILLPGAHGLVLADGLAPGLDLSTPPSMQAALGDQIGAKIWLSGDKLVSGQIKIRRYGILRPARRTP